MESKMIKLIQIMYFAALLIFAVLPVLTLFAFVFPELLLFCSCWWVLLIIWIKYLPKPKKKKNRSLFKAGL